jgi:MIP family channel proteins
MNIRNLVVEFIGTFALIFIGAGALAINQGGLVGVALAHGLVIVAFAYAYGHISGTHINPAVTLGLLVAGEIQFTAAIGYWVVQFAGGIAGALVLKAMLPVATDLGVTVLQTMTNSEGTAVPITVVQGLIVEIVLTFFLVNTIFNTAVSGKAGNFAGLAIGLTLVLAILMGGPLTRASLNPARTLGPAIASGTYTHIWLYFVGPFIGAVLAALLYIGVLKEKESETE